VDASLADKEPGSVKNASVTFQEEGATLCGPLPLDLLEGTASGSASCRVPLWEGAHSIEVVVGGFYAGRTTSVVEVGDPEDSVATGAGSFVATEPGGPYAADAGSRPAFAFHVKYTVRETKDKGYDKKKSPRDPAPPKGHVEVLFRSHGRSYAIRSADLDLLGVSEETPQGKECHGRAPKCIGRVDMRWSASLVDVTKPGKPLSVGADLALQLTATDKGDRRGSDDSIGISLWSGNTLLFSSRWTGAQTLDQVLRSGKITVD
jgi:hypothetical protein